MSIAGVHVDPSVSLASDEATPTSIQMSLIGSANVASPSILAHTRQKRKFGVGGNIWHSREDPER
jgi:hypothetical protein